ncbi:MAG: LysR family transcriptional regulator [Anaerolineaceae bacterium]|nr:LysR family transcriptional regulator [Anaerolineaceae bacterium]
MDIRQIQYFLAIVNTGSFSGAADELYISQSSLSKIIIALEKELNVFLFDRSKRKVFLTEAGQAFLGHARKLNADYKALLVELDEYKSETDTFSIAAIPVLTQYGITTSIAQFLVEHPGIHFVMEEIHGFNILPGLDEHRFDLAIARHNYIDPEKYTNIEISKDKLLVVVSKKNRHATSPSISIKELSKDNFIVFDKVTDLHRLIMHVCNDAGFEPTIFYSSQKKVSVFALVGTNIGLALIPSKIYEYHKDPDVVAIPLEEQIECNIVLIHLKNKKLPKSAEIFIQYLAKANPDNV